jgi:hypothetical protein
VQVLGWHDWTAVRQHPTKLRSTMYYTLTWQIRQEGTILPVIFVRRKDAVQYASDNGITSYELVRDDMFNGTSVRQVSK